jgi:hypothetical protein
MNSPHLRSRFDETLLVYYPSTGKVLLTMKREDEEVG